MSLLAGLTTNEPDVKQEQDTVGGGSKFGVVESGVYDATIKFAYLKKTDKGALALHLGADLDNGTEYKETLYLTTGDTKNNKTYSVQKDGTKSLLSGFVNAEAIALFTAQKPLAELATEEKIVKIYDYELKKDVPTPVPMVTALLNKPVKLGIKKCIKNAQKPDASGKWVDTGSVKEFNEIDKVFHPTNGKTVPELRAKKENAEFLEAWTERWDGKVHDTSSTKSKSDSGTETKTTTASKLFA